MVDAESKGPRVDVGAIFGLLWIGWGLGTPYFLYGAVIVATPFFGESPSEAEMEEAWRLLFAGLGCGLLLPLVGIVLAAKLRRRGTAWAFAGALTLMVTVLGYFLSR